MFSRTLFFAWFLVRAGHVRNLPEIWKAAELGRSLYFWKVSVESQGQLILVVTTPLTAAFGWWGGSQALSTPSSYHFSFSFSESWTRGLAYVLLQRGRLRSVHPYNQGVKWWETDNTGTSLSSQVCPCSPQFTLSSSSRLPALLTYSNFRLITRCKVNNLP